MKIFKNKYRTRIEKKIVELLLQRNQYKIEEQKISNLKPAERIHFIVLRAECEKQVELLRGLLK
jgi:FKBP-type peptidyl-prolyl cis-trans isomerase (trigger factor)